MDLSVWEQYFTAYQITVEVQVLAQIHQTYGGNAKAMGIFCGIIREDYDGNIGEYWQENHHDPLVETDLKNLVSSQFERLQQLDLQAYKLLCRLGCYRYQDLPKVILHSRENQWGQFLTLGTTLYRLGIIQPLLTAINQIIEQIDHDRQRSELHNILGDLYWTTGKIQQAIACQQKTIITSQNCLQSIPVTLENKHDLYYWRMLEVDSLLSLGLYNLDLWELTTAADLFQQVISLAENTKHHTWSEKAAIGLALVNSYLKVSQTPDYIVWRLYRLIVDLEDKTYNTGRFAYFMQLLGQILFNYQNIEPAQIIWQRAIAFFQASHYTQIEAKSLIGLGCIERQAANFALANTDHQQAIALLDKIGAKCDLAAAYVQYGITLFIILLFFISTLYFLQNFFQQSVRVI